MKFDPARHHRHAMRLKGYDYAQAGAYYVTICTYRRERLFGEVNAEGFMCLNACGDMVVSCWEDLPRHYPQVELDAFVVMPNHLHGILVLDDGVAGKRHSLSEVIRGFKTWSARRVNVLRGAEGVPVWQRSFYDAIIRDETMLNAIRQYIDTNPAQWSVDKENIG
ncbi:MAG: hypothetical protein BroJett038_02980 [Chloroflexota bacterium]|nr:MAG: hypothetical protein BroJett038_02980 [Chloroflexota bacterium]